MRVSKVWKLPQHARKRHWTGQFYNVLGAQTINGHVNGHVVDGWEKFGDISNPELGLKAESKASNGNHCWRLPMPQMGRYSDAKPLINYVYLLASYAVQKRTKVGEKRPPGIRSVTHSLGARTKSKKEYFNLLSRKTKRVVLLDLEFIQALQEARIGELNGDAHGWGDKPIYALRRWELYPLLSEKLDEFHFGGRCWVRRKYDLTHRFAIRDSEQYEVFGRILDYSVDMKFPLYTVLSPELDRALHPVILSQDCSDLPF